MKPDHVAIKATWQQRPMPAGEVVDRLSRLLTALARIDSRFQALLVGGSSPDPRDWVRADLSPAGLTSLLMESDASYTTSDGDRPSWTTGFWNGMLDETGMSLGIGLHAEARIPDADRPQGSFFHLGAGTWGLDEAQRDALARAVVESWDPDACTRRERVDEVTRVRTYTRAEGWVPGEGRG
jgi:hypothetical protein